MPGLRPRRSTGDLTDPESMVSKKQAGRDYPMLAELNTSRAPSTWRGSRTNPALARHALAEGPRLRPAPVRAAPRADTAGTERHGHGDDHSGDHGDSHGEGH